MVHSLKIKKYVETIKNTIKETVNFYALPVYNRDNLHNIPPANIQLTIDDQLFLETLLMEIRGKTISFSSWKKKQVDLTEKQLIENIQLLENKIQDQHINAQPDDKERLLGMKTELETIRDSKTQGIIIRSKARWIDKGEKPSKYFLHLESRNFTSKQIPWLATDDGRELHEIQDILEEQVTFYSKLYSEQTNVNTADSNTGDVLNSLIAPKLTDSISRDLEGEVSYTELTAFLKSTKNGKSPGLDGFTNDFFKLCWTDIGYYVLRSINAAYVEGEMSISQRRGVITCIPKGNKPKMFLKNWRPISLLSTVYKLASGCIANRVKRVLDILINEDQKGFVAGRFIGENIRLLYDIIHETKERNIPGLLLLVDFEKAFDSVSWDFINQVLQFFNFGPIRHWIQTFYNNSESCIIQNGFLSKCFKLGRGCRQGDPLSPYLFLLCADILGIMVRKNKDIQGISIDEQTHTICQYADDTQLLLDGT